MASTTKASDPIDDDYIDMEIISSSSSSSSSSNSFFSSSSSICSPPHSSTTKEFEFQMSSVPDQEKEALTFPADELFYKGKLLPLHLPPRLQMVQNILQTSSTTSSTSLHTKLEDEEEEEEQEGFEEEEEETFTIPFKMITRSASTAPCTNTNTPLDQSCNISPSESCRVSCELNPDEYLSQWSAEVRVFIGGPTTTTTSSSSNSKRYSSCSSSSSSSWPTKVMKQFSLVRKLKASRAYLKSLFNKSSCNTNSDNFNVGSFPNKPTCINNAEEADLQIDQLNGNAASYKKYPFGRMSEKCRCHQISTTLMKSIEDEIMAEAGAYGNMVNNSYHRKSFSGVIQRHISSGATTKLSLSSSNSSTNSTSSSGSSSSSSSFSLSSSNGCCSFDHLQLLKRSSSASSELESSIEGAIAHCKQSSSQQFCSSRKSTSQDGASFSLSRIAV